MCIGGGRLDQNVNSDDRTSHIFSYLYFFLSFRIKVFLNEYRKKYTFKTY